LGGKYLNQCSLFVTLEPCVMCAGALFWAQVGRLVYGADDEKRGYSLTGKNLLHPKTEVKAGVETEASIKILKSFFELKR